MFEVPVSKVDVPATHVVFRISNLPLAAPIRVAWDGGPITITPAPGYDAVVREVNSGNEVRALTALAKVPLRTPEAKPAREIMRRISSLLAFATGNDVIPCYHDPLPNGPKRRGYLLDPQGGRYFGGGPGCCPRNPLKFNTGTVDSRHREAFVRTALPLYDMLDETYWIDRVLGLRNWSLRYDGPIELRMLMVSTPLNILADRHWTRCGKSVNIVAPRSFGKGRKKLVSALRQAFADTFPDVSDNGLDLVANKVSELNRVPHSEVLAHLFGDFGIGGFNRNGEPPTGREYQRVRNLVVHAGGEGVDLKDLDDTYFWANDVLNRLLLRLFEFERKDV